MTERPYRDSLHVPRSHESKNEKGLGFPTVEMATRTQRSEIKTVSWTSNSSGFSDSDVPRKKCYSTHCDSMGLTSFQTDSLRFCRGVSPDLVGVSCGREIHLRRRVSSDTRELGQRHSRVTFHIFDDPRLPLNFNRRHRVFDGRLIGVCVDPETPMG